ncbi:hypothetical protein A2U01_0098215, partial [Trifolium medium]|nr:hypothetical protein [Trifolium medium]
PRPKSIFLHISTVPCARRSSAGARRNIASRLCARRSAGDNKSCGPGVDFC